MIKLKATKKEMEGKIYPKTIILQGSRYYPEEYFNPDRIERDVFSDEKVDLEDLWVEGTHAEGRDFYGNITNTGIKKFNEYKTEETIRFCPVYDYVNYGTPESIFVRRSNDLDNPVVYFLLEKEII